VELPPFTRRIDCLHPVKKGPPQYSFTDCLTHRPTESLVSGDNITVTVMGIKGARVRFGIDAPKTS
jgi:endonuclease YncB( thermonuclease family)